jgi:hypothetical protein
MTWMQKKMGSGGNACFGHGRRESGVKRWGMDVETTSNKSSLRDI